MLKTKLYPDDDVIIDDILFAVGPRTNACAATRLVGVLATRVQLVVVILGDVDVVISELGTFVVEGAGMGDHLLEGWSMDFVGYCLVVDGIPRIVVLDLVGPVGAIVGIKTTGLLNC